MSVQQHFEMTYNSQRETLIISEYGRNVQDLIAIAIQEPDDERRNAMAHTIIQLMFQLSQQNKTFEDQKERLWKHMFRIANYQLNVTPPEGIEIDPEKNRLRPEKVPYPVTEPKFRHYGHYVQEMIKKAIAMEDGPVKLAFVEVIGSYMKLAYRTWNREHYVSDDIIKDDIVLLSNGTLHLHDDAMINNLSNLIKKQPFNRAGGAKQQQNRYGNNRNNNRNNTNNSNNNNNRNNNNNNRRFSK